jgi:hypothetical protein
VKDAALVVIGAVLGWALTVATDWLTERRRRNQNLVRALMRMHAFFHGLQEGLVWMPEGGPWRGPTAPDVIDIALVDHELSDEDDRTAFFLAFEADVMGPRMMLPPTSATPEEAMDFVREHLPAVEHMLEVVDRLFEARNTAGPWRPWRRRQGSRAW